MTSIPRIGSFRFAAVAAASIALVPSMILAQSASQPFKGQTLRVEMWGGNTGKADREVSTAFERATGVHIEWTLGDELPTLAQLRAAKGTEPPYDVINISRGLVPQAINEGLIVKPDYSKIPNAKFIAPDLKNSDGYGPTWHYLRFGIAYLPDKLKAAGIPEPKDLSIFENPHLQGHSAIPDITQPNWAAGGIQSIAAFYGNSFKNPEPTLKKLAAIKGLTLYTSSAALESAFTNGEIWVALWTDGRTNRLRTKGVNIKFGPFGIPNPKGGTYAYTPAPAVVQISNPAKKDLAESYINWMLSKDFQVKYALATLYSPANVEAMKIVKADPKVGHLYEVGQRLYNPDVFAWAKYQAKWVDAWGKMMRN